MEGFFVLSVCCVILAISLFAIFIPTKDDPMAQKGKVIPIGKATPKGLCRSCFYNTGSNCAKNVLAFPRCKKCKEYIPEGLSNTPAQRIQTPTVPPKAPALLSPPSSSPPEKAAEQKKPTEAEIRRREQFDSYFEE